MNLCFTLKTHRIRLLHKKNRGYSANKNYFQCTKIHKCYLLKQYSFFGAKPIQNPETDIGPQK